MEPSGISQKYREAKVALCFACPFSAKSRHYRSQLLGNSELWTPISDYGKNRRIRSSQSTQVAPSRNVQFSSVSLCAAALAWEHPLDAVGCEWRGQGTASFT
jgi:hypothetical protein